MGKLQDGSKKQKKTFVKSEHQQVKIASETAYLALRCFYLEHSGHQGKDLPPIDIAQLANEVHEKSERKISDSQRDLVLEMLDKRR